MQHWPVPCWTQNSMFHGSQIKTVITCLLQAVKIIFLCILSQSSRVLFCAAVAENRWDGNCMDFAHLQFCFLHICNISVFAETLEFDIWRHQRTPNVIREQTNPTPSWLEQPIICFFLEQYAGVWCILFLSYFLAPFHYSDLFFEFLSLTPSPGHIYNATITVLCIIIAYLGCVLYIAKKTAKFVLQ